jgi:DNA modification methylase
VRLLKGDCREQLKLLPDESVDSIVTDPPYELGFMGKSWDASGIAYNVEVWRECLRVLKPGGHLLAFGGSRTYHRLACAVEDAGFEIRDQIMWVYGSGFPKSLDVGKAIDKQRDDKKEILTVTNWIADAVAKSPCTHRDILQAFGFNEGSGMVGHWTARTAGSQPSIPTLEQVPTLLDTLGLRLDDVPDDIRELLWTLNGRKGQPGDNWFKRDLIGTEVRYNEPSGIVNVGQGERILIESKITAPATDDAKKWDGWGTALKPAHEPVVVARKPLTGTVAQNVLRYGTGAINIDGCRVEGKLEGDPNRFAKTDGGSFNAFSQSAPVVRSEGRWPANFIHDGSDEVLELFPETKPEASAARFFYCAKASKAERNAALDTPSTHPTVKPINLMRYLIRLVTPPNGTVLDPFAGSGTTLVAAIHEHMNPIGIELTEEYWPIIEARTDHARNKT